MKSEAHRGIRKFLPLRRDEVPNPSTSSRQGNSSDEKNHQHDVRERGREVHHLEKPPTWGQEGADTRDVTKGASTEAECELPPGRKCLIG